MKLVYFITTLKGNSGRGGHYYSLKTIANEMSKDHNVTVVNLGFKDSIVLNESENNFEYFFLKINILTFLSSFLKLKSLVQIINPEVVHCFDRSAYLWGAYAASKLKLKLFLTKCGGNIPSWFPNPKNFIVFNPKDFDYYQNLLHKDNNIYLFPNRVTHISPDNERIEKLKKKYVKEGEMVLLRIARFTKLNKPSIEQSLNLIDSLNKRLNIRLIIIGDIQDRTVYDSILKKINYSNTTIIIDPYFTLNANELIPIASAVVSSGRSLMEAAFFERPVLVPNISFNIPVLLTKKSFTYAFYENFSYRTSFNDVICSEEHVLEEIINVLTMVSYQKVNKEFLTYTNKEYFSLISIVPNYIKLYKNASVSSSLNLIKDFGINFIFVLKSIL